MNLLREYIRELLEEEHQQKVLEENIIKTAMGFVKKIDDAIHNGTERMIAPYFEKLHKWMESNAESIPGYGDEKYVKDLKEKIANVTLRAEEAREEWKNQNPNKEPPWEKTILGMKASRWFPAFFPDPADEVWDDHLG
jgi:hypothetical protein